MVRAKRHSLVSLRPRNLSVPSYRPIQKDGCTETVHQLVPGSGEGQHTGTIDDYHRMDRREAHACGLLLSSLPFSTIAYQRVCWGPHTLSRQWSGRATAQAFSPHASQCAVARRSPLAFGVKCSAEAITRHTCFPGKAGVRSLPYEPICVLWG
jgi:hypothetical protein